MVDSCPTLGPGNAQLLWARITPPRGTAVQQRRGNRKMPWNDGTEYVISGNASSFNAATKSANAGLDRMEQAAIRTTRSASSGLDAMTVAALKADKSFGFATAILQMENLED